MDFIHVLILSLVEGLTEFLPISSTGHLILTAKLLEVPSSEFLKTFEIVIQFGAILAVFVLYFKRFVSDFSLYKNLFWAFLPTAIVGLIFYPIIKIFLGNTNIVIWSLFIGGIGMILFEKLFKDNKVTGKKLMPKDYLIIGLLQSVSVIPGVSRAMATIYAGRIVGMSKVQATEFSFFLAFPTMLAASLFDLYKSMDIISAIDRNYLMMGVIFSFVFAVIAIKFLLNYIKTHDFTIFGWYRIILAVIFLLFSGR